ncbi:MAG: LytTR family transcriptional regulator DNA-binding domain-containing protein [Clostridia bacterium]|nr:LytTR family transcriptional regulator DNA-binding domain-containing protein [Clostridia bacterium]
MKDAVDIEIRIDPDCHDPVILIRTDQKTQEVENIVHAIENCMDSRYPPFVGYRDNAMELLSQRDIVMVYVESRKVQIRTEKGTFDSRRSLSYLEQLLNPERFIRISRFEIVNIRKIASFDFSMAGTVHILFDDGTVTWAARRYVRSIQQALERVEAGEED